MKKELAPILIILDKLIRAELFGDVIKFYEDCLVDIEILPNTVISAITLSFLKKVFFCI